MIVFHYQKCHIIIFLLYVHITSKKFLQIMDLTKISCLRKIKKKKKIFYFESASNEGLETFHL